MEFLHPVMWHDHDIDFARWLHPLESWQWIHQVAAPCNVIRGSGMTCHRIRSVVAPCNVTCSSGIITLNSPGWQHPAVWQVALGWHAMEFAQTFAILESYICVRFRPHHRSRHVILYQSAKFYPNRTTFCRKKWCHVDFQDGEFLPSWILGIQ